ncbi:MBL fold metallo-hydrolase [Desulfovibrio sp. An276]|uniref:MBL fold metallo-hydrolase n=1 Tax=Desulfovibrio sp. An276 TaxID=1965618 RepID=UPI000B3824D8|nr:MBL fold metallo-hydrolase [Desulfovibrio sp. An276]OUO54211.1 MBL fold metallo-hydrolase [Desulfovibrio sp. An276]
MHVNSFPLGPLGTNSYILDNGIEALAIDVGGDPADMLAFLSRNNLKLLAILITHRHFDHLYGVAALQKVLDVPCYLPSGEEVLRDSEAAQGGIWGMPMVPAFSETSLSEGSTRIGSFEITVLNTPGHTPGSVSYYIREAGCVFTGDALFYRSVGRTDFPMGDHQKLLASIRENLFTLPPETIVYPGHGPQSSIGDERQHNPFVGDFA